MGKSEKKKAKRSKSHPRFEEEEQGKPKPALILLSSDDDEANDDLSLKIVEKLMLRACDNDNNKNRNPSSEPEVIITDVKKKRKKQDEGVIGARDNAAEDVESKEEGGESKATDVTLEMDSEEKSDNIVLRKLLRGPRYFDAPDNNWGNCYNCGEGGHAAANCSSAKRKKPCFVCGSLEHNVKQCKQGKDCFICKKGGHRAKDCTEKITGGSEETSLCLKCGNSGHHMLSCQMEYSPDDLKEIQCYVCKCFGHLCCVNYAGAGPREVSCYRCGQLGHTGLECASLRACARAETTSNGTPSSCYKCGEEGHMARNCKRSAKKGKRKGDFSTPKQGHIGVPHDLGETRKRNKRRYGHSASPQPKHRGGWITQDPGDYYPGGNHNANANGWGSPKTPSSYKSNNRSHGNGRGASDYGSGFHNNGWKSHYESSSSNQYQHRFSASRFRNSNSNYGRREYSWDY